MFAYFDTHIHLFAPEWSDAVEDLHHQARAAGIIEMLMPGVRVGDWDKLLGYSRALDGAYFAPGLHPAFADQWDERAEQRLRALTQEATVVAIGEIGLDGVYGPALDVQEAVFRRQLEIAMDSDLPVLLHCRNRMGAMIKILREMSIGQRVGGVWHAFSGSVDSARGLIDLGFKLGVGPILLRENARKLPRVVAELALEDLLLETDAPDMIDRSDGVVAVAQRLAEIKGLSVEEVVDVTRRNAANLFGLG